MFKNIFKCAVIIALLTGISYSTIAQTKAVKIDNTPATEAKQINTRNASPDGENAAESLQKRIEMQVHRYTSDYNLTEKQQTDLTAILTDIEGQLLEIRNRQNLLNKEKADRIDALLTKEQKETKEQSLKERRDKMLEKRKEGRTEAEQLKPRTVKPDTE
ncbi:MAG: hypothetical protein FWG85_02495 [Bacteroidetes bacterium]|nr:hypothetical protein [Bacteroidota bacterium]